MINFDQAGGWTRVIGFAWEKIRYKPRRRKHVFQVTAGTLQAYLEFDPERKHDLLNLDKLNTRTAPALKRFFHAGTPVGEAGMRMKMIGYGKFRYAIKSGKSTEWPVIGVALQKNYISVYVSATRQGAPIVPSYAGQLGELRVGANNFSFERLIS
jgi:hypothetical protein